MKSSFCIDLQIFMLIPTKFPLSQYLYCLKKRVSNFFNIKQALALYGMLYCLGDTFIEEIYDLFN